MSRKRIFARYKVPKITEIKEFTKKLESQAKYFGVTKDQLFDSVLRGLVGDITSSTEKIFREKQRIKKAKKTLIIFYCVASEINTLDEMLKVFMTRYYKIILIRF